MISAKRSPNEQISAAPLSRRLVAVIQIACMVSLGLALAAQLGRLSGALDLLTHFALLYLAVGAMALLAAPLAQRDRRAQALWLALGTLSAAAALIAPGLARQGRDEGSPVARPRQVVRLIQFNAWRENRQPKQVAHWLAEQKPDVVLLEEVSPALRDAVLAQTQWNVVGRQSDVMIFSPHPLVGRGVRPTAHARVEPTWVNAVMLTSGGEVPVVATHRIWPVFDLADDQGRLLAYVVSRLPNNRLILSGDFNATPWSFVFRHREAQFAPLTRRDSARPTWPVALLDSRLGVPLAFLPIDHLYAGPEWRTLEVKRGPRLGSDHLPLVATLAR